MTFCINLLLFEPISSSPNPRALIFFPSIYGGERESPNSAHNSRWRHLPSMLGLRRCRWCATLSTQHRCESPYISRMHIGSLMASLVLKFEWSQILVPTQSLFIFIKLKGIGTRAKASVFRKSGPSAQRGRQTWEKCCQPIALGEYDKRSCACSITTSNNSVY